MQLKLTGTQICVFSPVASSLDCTVVYYGLHGIKDNNISSNSTFATYWEEKITHESEFTQIFVCMFAYMFVYIKIVCAQWLSDWEIIQIQDVYVELRVLWE